MIGAVKQRYIIQQRPKSSKENLIQFWRAEEALLLKCYVFSGVGRWAELRKAE